MTEEARQKLAVWRVIRDIAEFVAKQPDPPDFTDVLIRQAHSEVSFYEHLGHIASRRARFRVIAGHRSRELGRNDHPGGVSVD